MPALRSRTYVLLACSVAGLAASCSDRGAPVDAALDALVRRDADATDDGPPVRDDVAPPPDAPPTMDAAPDGTTDAGPDGTANAADAGDDAPAPPDTLPGGRRYYTVAFGRFTSTCEQNWVRLEYVTFNADGTVDGAYYQWTESEATAMESASTANPRCTSMACNVWTPTPFASRGGVTQSGRFTLSGDTVTIAWAGGYRDRWRVSRPAADLARLDWLGSDSAATHGYGFGSNWSTNRFLTLAQLDAPANHGTYNGEYASAVGTRIITGSSGIAFDGSWTRCQASDPTCLRLVSPHSPDVCTAGCGAYGDPEGTITYYLASSNASRRNAYENYCTCLAQGAQCYDRGSHVKPMLQVIGDEGAFHGWVGVEASVRSAACVGATIAVYSYTKL